MRNICYILMITNTIFNLFPLFLHNTNVLPLSVPLLQQQLTLIELEYFCAIQPEVSFRAACHLWPFPIFITYVIIILIIISIILVFIDHCSELDDLIEYRSTPLAPFFTHPPNKNHSKKRTRTTWWIISCLIGNIYLEY